MKEKRAKKRPFVTRNVFFLGVVSFFSDVSTEMIYPLIPLFLNSVLHVSFPFIGLIEGIAESTASLFRVVSGWLSDKLARRRSLITAGYGLAAIAKPFLSITTNGFQVLFIRFLDRSGKGIRTAPRDALIAESTPAAERGRAFGFHRSFDTAGAIVGPLIALLLLPLLNKNLRLIFLLALIPGLISVAFIALVKEKRKVKEQASELLKIKFSDLDGRFKLFLVIIVIFSIGNSSDVFLILRAQNLGISIVLIPAAYLLINVVYVIFSTPAGILSDRIGRKRLIWAGFAVFSIAYLGLAVATSSVFVWIFFALYGLYYAFTEGVIRAFTADLIPTHLLGTAYGLLNTLIGLSLLPASIIAGFLWERIDPSAPFYFGAATSLAAFVLLFLFFGIPALSGKKKAVE